MTVGAIALPLLAFWLLVYAAVALGLGSLFLLWLILWVARQGWQPRLSAAEMRRMYPGRST